MIRISNITKRFRDKLALDHISFEVKKGEIVGLLGPNGAGKSTTMKIITGFLIPDSGEVWIDEKRLSNNLIPSRQKIGYMPENNPLYSDMLVKDLLGYSLKLHNIPKGKREERMDFVVKSTGLAGVYYRPIGELSKGFRQRVGLASCIIHDPKILILDEPTEGLDPNQRQEIRKLIKELGKNKTIIISTHVMQEVEAMCTRIVVINDGQIVLDGEKNKVIEEELGTGFVSFTIEGDVGIDDLKKLNLDGLKKVSFTKKSVTFRANIGKKGDFFSKFSELASEKHWVVYNLSNDKRSLEELFTKLTLGKNKVTPKESTKTQKPTRKIKVRV